MEMNVRATNTILVVDDDDIKRYTIVHFLQNAGFQTLEAESGQKAIELASQSPDLIVLDISLPDISGFEVCERIKASPQTALIPILQISAVYIKPVDRVHGLETGADAYLTSSNEPTEWIATIRALIRAREAERESRELAQQWQTTFDAIGDGICLLDSSHVVQRCNQSIRDFIDPSCEQPKGIPLTSVLFPSGRDTVRLLLEEVASARKRRTNEFRLEDRWIRVLIDPIQTENQDLIGIACIFQDITASKQVEQQLLEMNDVLDQRVKERTQSLVRYQNHLRSLVAELTLTEQREKKRLATDLHDYLAQMLVVCKMRLDQLQRTGDLLPSPVAEEMQTILDRSLHYTRNLIAELSPQILYESGLPPAIDWLAGQMKNHGLEVSVRHGRISHTLSESKSVLLFQVVRELLFNIVKHGQTATAAIALDQETPDELTLTVEDQGVGFDTSKDIRENVPSGHFGLFSIRERIESIDGRFHIASAPGQGTRVTLTVPLASDAPTLSSAG